MSEKEEENNNNLSSKAIAGIVIGAILIIVIITYIYIRYNNHKTELMNSREHKSYYNLSNIKKDLQKNAIEFHNYNKKLNLTL